MPVYFNGKQVNYLPREELRAGDRVILPESIIERAKYGRQLREMGRIVKTHKGPFDGYYTVDLLSRPRAKTYAPKRKVSPRADPAYRRRAERRAWHRARIAANPFN
jgi:hypothetical protein